MKVLLLNPPYISFSGIKNSGGHAIPLNIAYLAAFLRSKIKCEIKILDCENYNLTYAEVCEEIQSFEPDVAAITFPTPAFEHVLRITEDIKRTNNSVKIIVGGPHPSAFPSETASIPSIDYVVFGEGEMTFFEVISHIMERKNDLKDVPGVAYKKNKEVIVNLERDLMCNLDIIPFPARDLFDLKRYYPAATKRVSDYKSTSIITSRGCPYGCKHCISQLIWKRKTRYRSLDNVLEEIRHCIQDYDIREFNFYDDTFTLDKKRVMEFCQRIIDEQIKIAWICFGRVNVIDREMAVIMKKAGCRKISFGLESGSQQILDMMNKAATLEMARKAVGAVSAAGLDVHASFMLGNVGETHDTIRQTVDFAKSLELDNATFFITSPFPGTALYDIALGEGLIGPDVEWARFAPITKAQPVLVQKNVTGEELIRLQKKAFIEFYLRFGYIARKVSKIRSLEDIKVALEGVGVFCRLQKKK